ncbi:MAG: hypothetical protein E7370_06420 [Clostridiales bacterium]|nr:hypothetical protein [Clostridiales bacterium]
MKINKKTVFYAFLGLLLVMVVCLAVGIILYLTAKGIQIPENALNYTQLLQQKAIKIIMGNTLMIVGGVGAFISIAVIIGVAIKKIIDERNF